jgi:hypothetical protein
MSEFVIPEDLVIEAYQYAQQEYRKAIGERDKDYWDGYAEAIEELFPEVVAFNG